jgi:hypothetical protein
VGATSLRKSELGLKLDVDAVRVVTT